VINGLLTYWVIFAEYNVSEDDKGATLLPIN